MVEMVSRSQIECRLHNPAIQLLKKIEGLHRCVIDIYETLDLLDPDLP